MSSTQRPEDPRQMQSSANMHRYSLISNFMLPPVVATQTPGLTASGKRRQFLPLPGQNGGDLSPFFLCH